MECGISPVDLLATPAPIFAEMVRYLNERTKQADMERRKMGSR